MSELPKFHTFREACECIAAGGAAARFGSEYTYCMGSFGVEKRGTMVSQRANFDLIEQASTDWILVPPDEWKRRQDELREWYRKEDERRMKEWDKKNAHLPPPPEEETVIRNGHPVIVPKRRWWEFWK